MAGSLDIVTILKRELPALNLPASTVASLAGISPSKLTSYLNGVGRCGHDHDIKLRAAWSGLKKFLEYAGPIPVDFRRVDKLRESIQAMAEGRLKIVVIHEPEEWHEQQQ